MKNFLKNNLGSIISAILLSGGAAFWSTFISPNLVFAEDINVVTDSIEQNNQQISELASVVRVLAKEQKEIRIDYLQDSIRELEVKDLENGLTPSEQYQLREYKDRLKKIRSLDLE